MTARVVVVVGGSSGIGPLCARRFGADGDQLVLAARADQALQRAADRSA
jgi:NADP-dependent 3-hydroxy acid dehydrogenase YdfG